MTEKPMLVRAAGLVLMFLGLAVRGAFAGPVASFAVQGLPATIVAGAPATFTVVALDSSGATATDFTGTVTFSANEPNATLPADYTFTAADGGVHSFQLAAYTAASFWVQATSTASAGVYGYGSSSIVAAPAAHLAYIAYSGSAIAGVPLSATVAAYDPWWNRTAYTGTAVFTSDDPGATLPVAPAFTNGATTVNITFANGGVHSVSVADSAHTTTPDTFWTVVAAPPSATITAPASVTAGASAAASVAGQTGVTYAWTISGGTITSGSGTNAITFTAGPVGTLTLTCTVTNTSNGAQGTGTANVNVVAAPTPTTPTITATSPVTTGVAGLTASVAARDGMTYAWTISGGTITSAGGTAGVTSGGINQITYTAGPVGTLTLTCVESTTSASSSPDTRAIAVVAAPVTPTITTAKSVTAGQTNVAASVTANAGMTYVWTIAGGTITSPGGSAGTTTGDVNAVAYTAGSSPTIVITAVEVNAAGAVSSPATANVADLANTGPSGTVFVLAHADDETLFFEPDLHDSLASGKPTTQIWITAAGSNDGPGVWQARENQSRNTTAGSLGLAVPAKWNCGPQTYGSGQAVTVCTLAAVPGVTNVYLRLPDGAIASLWARDSGEPFYVDPAATLQTVDGTSTYSRADLTNVLTQLLATYSPAVVGTMDGTFAYGDEHTDHQSTALFAFEAVRASNRPLGVHIYRGYTMDGADYYPVPVAEVPDLSPADVTLKTNLLSYYGLDCAPNGFGVWCGRRYAISRLDANTGPLESTGGCLDVKGGQSAGSVATLAPCSGGSSQEWTFAANGSIQTQSGLCLDLGADGASAVLAACSGQPSQAWLMFSNGQIRGAAGVCLSTDGVSAGVAACDADRSSDLYAPLGTERWAQGAAPAATWSAAGQFSDSEVGSALTYSGTVRLADVNGDGYADACVRLSDGVHCALNQRDGTFAAHTLWSSAFSDANGWSGDAYGSTLMFADIDGDGRADVCGRSASGVVCALAQAGGGFGPASSWTADFSDAQGYGAAESYYGSIRLADVNGDGRPDVCARSSGGVVCALNTGSGGFATASLWTGDDFTDALGWQQAGYGATLMFGDLDGDGRADVCGRGPDGVHCALASGGSFIKARPWSFRTDFSDAAGWGASRASWGSLRLADVDGDGLADLCGRSAQGLVCATSNGGSFDAETLLTPGAFTDALGFSTDAYGGSLALGDLTGDRRADVCVRSSSGLVCAVDAGVPR